MVELIAEEARERDVIYAEFLGALSDEYAFWMDGADALAPGSAHRHVVRLKDGTLLNRYWDDRDIPREESYREDVNTAKAAGRPPEEVYRDLRAAAESGWDFSSRWLEDGRTLSTIRTTEFRAGRSQQPHGPARDDPRAGLRSRAQAGEGGGANARAGAA